MTGTLTVPASTDRLGEIRSWVEAVASVATAEPSVVPRLVLAVHEIAANIVEHAYDGRTDGMLTITIITTAGQILTRVDHTGSPFDGARLKPPVFDGTETRGFGMWLAARACDDLYFVSHDAHHHSAFLTLNLTGRTS
jgi:anti-sigma regulatory factor (Ser/Thr protein kinase)